MALTIYTTFICDWSEGTAEPLSTHLTKFGAQKRTIDYLLSTLYSWSRWHQDDVLNDFEETIEELVELYEQYGVAWDEDREEIQDLKQEDAGDFLDIIQGILDLYEGAPRYDYYTTTLEG